MELIDKQKVLEWLVGKIEIFGYGGSKGGKGEKWAFGYTKEAIERGRFDDYSTQQEIAKLKEERNALLEGLKWYADHTNYHPYRFQEENGRRARDIIAKIEGESNETIS